MIRIVVVLVAFAVLGLDRLAFALVPTQAQSPRLEVLTRTEAATTAFADGDELRLKVSGLSRVAQPTIVTFTLDNATPPVTQCTLAVGSDNCATEPFLSLGWYWDTHGQPQPRRRLIATSPALTEPTSLDIVIAPRPVVLVHGLNSSATSWRAYLGPHGFLARLGLTGYAVGDGQVEGVLNTGSLQAPTQPTNTVAANAEILGGYISRVKEVSGAQQVDLVVHSLGGLISRYYIARLMQTRDVAQLIMLGSPHQGTDCANLPLALGFYLPATLEIRTSYMRDIFNRQITRRAGVPFYVVAGTRIFDRVGSPCTSVPSDLVVSRDSAVGIQVQPAQIPLLHTDLNASEALFNDHVAPWLRASVGQFPAAPDPEPDTSHGDTLQFTRVFTGHVAVGGSVVQRVNIDQAAVASFALFDPTQSLTVTVRGASGAVLPLTPAGNGLIRVDDPTTLVHLGYGFNNPRPGPWEITLRATSRTPSEGAGFALTAHLVGGAVLSARTSVLLPQPGEAVELSAQLDLNGQPLIIRQATAIIRPSAGQGSMVTLAPSGTQVQGVWHPTQPGLHGIDIMVTADAPDGTPIERIAFLSVEVEPTAGRVQMQQRVAISGFTLFVLTLLVGLVGWRLRRARRRID